MNDPKAGDVHTRVVAKWEKERADALNDFQKTHLFELGIHSVEKRATATLSQVTLKVVFNRVFTQALEEFPIISSISLEDCTFDFKNCYLDKNLNHKEMIPALRYLLIELLRVLGRITADILNTPLHDELRKVTWSDLEKK